jgi:hypothetical protein
MPQMIVTGNVTDGFQFVGPFASLDDALVYTDSLNHSSWTVTDLSTPDPRYLPEPEHASTEVRLHAWMDHDVILGDRYEWAAEWSIDALSTAGYAPDNADELGCEIGDQLQTLLMMLAVRSPRLAAQIPSSEADLYFSPDALSDVGLSQPDAPLATIHDLTTGIVHPSQRD